MNHSNPLPPNTKTQNISPRFRTGSYNFPVDSEESIQSLMTAININNVRLLSQLL